MSPRRSCYVTIGDMDARNHECRTRCGLSRREYSQTLEDIGVYARCEIRKDIMIRSTARRLCDEGSMFAGPISEDVVTDYDRFPQLSQTAQPQNS
ncbi:hypothetical protein J6590_034786 [Homalodisca vitripennis]|nr:hypothetical protein J6590_034786 [Homalodisca vitripennis]